MTSATGQPSAVAPVAQGRPLGRTGVTTAVLFATAPGEDEPAALLRWDGAETIVERLLAQLRSLGIGELHLVGRPEASGLHELARGSGDVTLHVCATPADDLELVAGIARTGSGDLLIAQADVVLHGQALAGLAADPRIGTGALTTVRKLHAPFQHPMRVRRGRVMSAGSPFHAVIAPNCTFLGLVKVAAADRGQLAGAAEQLAALRADPPTLWQQQLEVVRPGSWKLALARRRARMAAAEAEVEDEAALEARAHESEYRGEPDTATDHGDDDDPLTPDDVELEPADAAELERRLRAAHEDVVALLLVGLVRADVVVGVGRLRGFFWARPLSPDVLANVRERYDRADEHRALLRSAVKANDGFFTTFFVSPYSQHIAAWCARRGFTPNQVTTFSMALGVLAAAGFATGARWGMVAGAILLQAAFTFDCVDGQLARYTRTFSKLGAWLDSIFDRSKEYVVFAGLAIGAGSSGVDPWLLACAALALQTTRHTIDFTYPVAQQQAMARLTRPPLEQASDGRWSGLPRWLRAVPASDAKAPPRPPAPPARGWRRVAGGPRVRWVKKAIVFPIGERFAVISITAALFDAETTFIALLAWGVVALAWVLAGRLVRTVRSRRAILGVPSGDERLKAYRDDGPLARGIGRALGGAVALPSVALLGAAGVLLAVAVAVWGDGASTGAAAAVVALLVALGGVAAGRPHDGRLRWLGPVMLRAIELSAVVWLAAIGGHAALPAAFGLLCAIVFHHYDSVYRQRQRGDEVSRRVADAGGGWDGRLLAVTVLVALAAVPLGLWVLAGALAALFVGAAVRSWMVAEPMAGDTTQDDDDEEVAG